MREVLPRLVWIGNARDGRDVAEVISREIAAVVDLAMEEAPAKFPREIIYCRFPLIDGAGNSPAMLQLAVRTLARLIETGTPTLVTCGGGMSRSPALVAAALAMANGGAPDDWLKQIAAAGPHDVAPALWNDLRRLTSKL
jgi:protein-tyrosine phosphatase